MDENIRLIEPNMAMFLKDHELKFYNLIYSRSNVDNILVQSEGYENYLLVRVADGTMAQTSYPTIVELQTQVDSLDYDGEYFWSVQPLNDTPYYPGTVIRKWQIEEEQYGVGCVQSATFPGFNTAKALAVEYYNFPLMEGIDPSRNVAKVSPDYGYAVERIRVGQNIKIGPNIQDEVYSGRVASVVAFPYDTRWATLYYEITFSTYFNTSYVAGHNCFVEARIFVITDDGYLWEVDPTPISLISSRQMDVLKGANNLAFGLMNHQSTINLGNPTPSLFTRKGMNIFIMQTTTCMDTDNTALFIACQSLPLEYYSGGNTFIPSYELRVRNDSPDDNPNYPLYYLLQQDYKESDTAAVDSWDTLNYITHMLPAQATFMSVRLYPEFLVPSGYTTCVCNIMNDYMVACSNIPVNWSVSPSTAGQFVTATGTVTNANGLAYATFSGAGVIPFPTYIYATTTAF